MDSRETAPAPPGCLAYGLLGLALAWVVGITVVPTIALWSWGQVAQISGGHWLAVYDVAGAIVQALLIAAPVGLLLLVGGAPLLRPIYRSWLLAAGCLALLALARGLPTSWAPASALAQTLLALGLSVALLRLSPPRPAAGPPSARASGPLLLGLLPAPLLLLPWLRYGALGSPLDTLLGLLNAESLGLLAGLLISRVLLGDLLAQGNLGRARLLGGLASAGVLLMLAAGGGYAGNQLLLLAALPGLAFGIPALIDSAEDAGTDWVPLAGLVGAAAAGPLLLFDPSELTPLLGLSDIPGLALRAALWSILAGLGASGVLWLARRLTRPALLGGGLALGGGAVALVYALAGHPGFYGDKLFVILRDQADLSGAAKIANREERLRFVYTTLTAHATRTQAGLRAVLSQTGTGYTPYYLVNGIEVDGGPLLRAYLAARPEVDRVLLSPRLRPLDVPPPPEPGSEAAPAEPEWNLRQIGADRVWRELGVSGKGIVIGQSDSGADGGHPALAGSYRGRDGQNDYSWIDPWYGSQAPRDYGMHGTHTLGSMVGRGVGVAPDATWMACVNLARNLGNAPHYLDCMQFMLAPYAQGADPLTAGDPARAAHVLNNSWGCPPEEGCDALSLQPAVDALRAAGIFVVASAGNEGPDCATVAAPIATYDSVLSVGAVDEQGGLARFSSRGPVEVDGSLRPKPDLVAPGVQVLSTTPGGSYDRASGTSMAGPHVAGVVALMWSANPKLIGNIDRTEQLLLETVGPYRSHASGDLSCDTTGGRVSNSYGVGEVDAYAAVKAALAER